MANFRRVDARFRGEDERFADNCDRRADDHLIRRLGHLAGASVADVYDVFTQRLKDWHRFFHR